MCHSVTDFGFLEFSKLAILPLLSLLCLACQSCSQVVMCHVGGITVCSDPAETTAAFARNSAVRNPVNPALVARLLEAAGCPDGLPPLTCSRVVPPGRDRTGDEHVVSLGIVVEPP